MLSPHPADPTLTTDNLMAVVKGVEHRWDKLEWRLGVSVSKGTGITILFSYYQRMKAVLDYYVKYHPAPSWRHFAETLQRMGLHEQADEVTTKYVKGMI